MSVIPLRSEVSSRGARMLRTALGGDIARWLDEPDVIEVMLNPDGRLWVDRLGEGLAASECLMSAADGERIIRLVAHHVGAEVHVGAPRVSAELPEGGERFEGLLPPVVAAPAFAIRKPAVAVFTLDDYVVAGIMSADQAATLRAAVSSRANILVAGGTGKSPVCRTISTHLLRSGRRPAIAMRGYRAGATGVSDEAAEYASRIPEVPLAVGADRIAAIAALEDPPGSIVLDDGFQHRRVHRDLDIVLVDAVHSGLDNTAVGNVFRRESESEVGRCFESFEVIEVE